MTIFRLSSGDVVRHSITRFLCAQNKCKTLNIISYESHLYKSNCSPKSDSQRPYFFVSGLLSGSTQSRNNADEPQRISRHLSLCPPQKRNGTGNNEMLNKAEAIRCIRVQSLINEEFGFLDKTKQKADFLAYFKKMRRKKDEK